MVEFELGEQREDFVPYDTYKKAVRNADLQTLKNTYRRLSETLRRDGFDEDTSKRMNIVGQEIYDRTGSDEITDQIARDVQEQFDGEPSIL